MHPIIHAFIHSFLHIHSFINSLIPSFMHSFLLSFLHSFLPLFLRSFIYSFIQIVKTWNSRKVSSWTLVNLWNSRNLDCWLFLRGSLGSPDRQNVELSQSQLLDSRQSVELSKSRLLAFPKGIPRISRSSKRGTLAKSAPGLSPICGTLAILTAGFS